jgi:hypothetical protein
MIRVCYASSIKIFLTLAPIAGIFFGVFWGAGMILLAGWLFKTSVFPLLLAALFAGIAVGLFVGSWAAFQMHGAKTKILFEGNAEAFAPCSQVCMCVSSFFGAQGLGIAVGG